MLLNVFVANNREHERLELDSLVTNRALREIYLLLFHIAARDSRPGVFMTSYNRIEKLKKDGVTISSGLTSSTVPEASTQAISTAMREGATRSSHPTLSANPEDATRTASTANNTYNISMNSQGGPQFQGGTFSGTTFS